MKDLSNYGLAQASLGVLLDGDFAATEFAIGREFTSKKGIDFVELLGSEISVIIQAGMIGRLAKDFPQSVLNKEGKPAKVGERFSLAGQIGASNGVLYAV
jgi:hypothetical protein